MLSFSFGGDSGVSYEEMQRTRERELALRRALTRAPTNIGTGLNSLGQGIAAAILGARANRQEGKLQAIADGEFEQIMQALMGGGGVAGGIACGCGGFCGCGGVVAAGGECDASFLCLY